MVSWALLLEYDGSPFIGWQRQQSGPSIQAVIEAAASRLNRGRPVESIVAGRTDAGVHATAQVAQLALAPDYDSDTLRSALNYHLKPHPIVVLKAARAAPGWHARFSAIRRAYRYRILNRGPRPGLLAGRVWHVHRPLDVEAMQSAARQLLGRHDFTSFRAASCQGGSPLRTLDQLDIRHEGEIIEVTTEARSFLQHQVRNMVGTLKLVGEGRWPPAQVGRILAAKDRSAAGPTAPPEGLYLTRVDYPADPFLSAGSLGQSARVHE
jgi:tRNA pseudouridine38-40 synthase